MPSEDQKKNLSQLEGMCTLMHIPYFFTNVTPINDLCGIEMCIFTGPLNGPVLFCLPASVVVVVCRGL